MINEAWSQCRCGPPPQQTPHDLGLPEQSAALGLALLLPVDANTDSFFVSLTDPQCGHFVPFSLRVRTRISLSFSHFSQ
jgi:hypothetical protein